MLRALAKWFKSLWELEPREVTECNSFKQGYFKKMSIISDFLDQLQLSLSEGDPGNLMSLSQPHTDLLRIKDIDDDPRLEQVCNSAAKILEQVMLRDVEDPEEAIEDIVETVSCLRAILVHHCPLETVTFPIELDTGGEVAQFEAFSHVSKGPNTSTTEASSNDQPEVDIRFDPIELSGDNELLADFVTESREHLEEADQHLLTIESNPEDSDAINGVFRAFHTIKGVAGFLAVKPVQNFAHVAETMLDLARKGTLKLTGKVLDLTFEANDALKQLLEGTESALSSDGVLNPDPNIYDLVKKIEGVGSPDSHQESSGQASAPAPKETPIPASKPESKEVEQSSKVESPTPKSSTASPEPSKPKKASKPNKPTKIREMIKVSADRLDSLIDTIGELVICEAMLNGRETWKADDAENLVHVASQINKITRNLQQMATSLRMLPVRSTFNRMARLARDVARKINKNIQFVTEGEDTELDKTVVDSIGDPLVHMVRNAVDHGLEDTEEERIQKGKPGPGTVTLRAFHKGGSICIEIEDDGRGLDREVLIKKAIEKGIIHSGDHLSDSEAYQLIFAPGFSTAKEVTDVSGRGVGMDVVMKGIEALRGKVEIRSELGKGTTFSIRLPLTLAIIDGMVVRVTGRRFIIPTLSIIRMVQPQDHQINTILNKEKVLRIGEDIIPVFNLDEIFEVSEGEKDISNCSILVVEDNDSKYAFIVDEIVGQQQIIIKNLGESLKDIPGLSGGAIMPDGTVGLILDISGLVRLAKEDSQRSYSSPNRISSIEKTPPKDTELLVSSS